MPPRSQEPGRHARTVPHAHADQPPGARANATPALRTERPGTPVKAGTARAETLANEPLAAAQALGVGAGEGDGSKRVPADRVVEQGAG